MANMKKKALLLMLVTMFLAANVFAQDTKSTPKLSSQEETDKRDVERFAAEFASLLDETKDLDAIPKRFFVDDYKEGVSISSNVSIPGLDTEIAGLTAEDGARFVTATQNFTYLTMLWNAGGDSFVYAEKEDDDEDEDEDEDEKKIADILPRDVCDTLRRSRITADILSLNDDDETERFQNPTPADVVEATNAFEDAARLLRLALGNRDGSWKATYNKNIAAAREKFAFYSSEECGAPFCAGLPDKTPVFYMGVFPLCVHMIREDGKIKIYQMHISGSDD